MWFIVRQKQAIWLNAETSHGLGDISGIDKDKTGKAIAKESIHSVLLGLCINQIWYTISEVWLNNIRDGTQSLRTQVCFLWTNDLSSSEVSYQTTNEVGFFCLCHSF